MIPTLLSNRIEDPRSRMERILSEPTSLTVGDAVWVAAALLQKENPDRHSFLMSEIIEKVKTETGHNEVSVKVHVNQHCVANRPPNPARLRMLFDVGNGERRLFCQGDAFDSNRNGRTRPDPGDLPAKYRPLLDWYEEWSAARRKSSAIEDPLLALRGSGKLIWANEHADTYIDNLRRETA